MTGTTFSYPPLLNSRPDLLENLVQIVSDTLTKSSGDNIHSIQENIMYTFHQVTKVLSTKSLLASRLQFEKVAPQLFEFTFRLFKQKSSYILTALSSLDHKQYPDVGNALSIANYCIKNFRRLFVHGFKDFRKEHYCVTAFQYIQHFQATLFSSRNAFKNDSLTLCISQLLHRITKVYIDMLKTKYFSFILTPGFSDVVLLNWRVLESCGIEGTFCNLVSN